MELDLCFWPRWTDRDQIYFWPETTNEKQKQKHKTTGKIYRTTVSRQKGQEMKGSYL